MQQNHPEVLSLRFVIQGEEKGLASVERHVLRSQAESGALNLDQGCHVGGFLFRQAKRSYNIGYIDGAGTPSRIVPIRKIPVALAGQFETILGSVRRKNFGDQILFGGRQLGVSRVAL
jgi:hypothetical protein